MGCTFLCNLQFRNTIWHDTLHFYLAFHQHFHLLSWVPQEGLDIPPAYSWSKIIFLGDLFYLSNLSIYILEQACPSGAYFSLHPTSSYTREDSFDEIIMHLPTNLITHHLKKINIVLYNKISTKTTLECHIYPPPGPIYRRYPPTPHITPITTIFLEKCSKIT